MTHTDWPYFTLSTYGFLKDEDGELVPESPSFNDVAEAEQWLEDNDIRGNVREVR